MSDPTFHTFVAADGSAVALIKSEQLSGSGKDRAARLEWHPVIFHGSSEVEAEQRARDWWRRELDRHRKAEANRAEMAVRMSERAAKRKAAQ